MSGYLTRLAERALESAPAVHANASLPYAPSPEPMADALGAAPVENKAERSAPIALPEDREPADPRPRDTPVIGASLARPSEAKRTGHVEGAAPNAVPVAQRAGPVRAETAGIAEPPAPAIERAAVEPPQHVLAHAQPGPRTLPRIESRPAQPRVPSPVIAKAVATLPPASHPAASTPAPPDVHIHIGRIELTAAPEAPAPRRVAKPTKAPMSLDEYLRVKGGGA